MCSRNKNMFLNEISAMMHTFGDVKEPKTESVKLMLAVLRDQVNHLLLKAEETTYIRRSKIISHEDILFLMRKNKMKLKRLIQYLHVLDLKSSLNNALKLSEDDEYIFESKSNGKRVKMCLEFLASIEDCDEITSVIQDETVMDVTSKKRQMRRHWMTFFMDSIEYEEFSRTCKAGAFRPVQKFKEWLLQDHVIDLYLADSAVRIIDFLARETIAEIVDMVLRMKMEKLGKNQCRLWCDCFSNLIYADVSGEFSSGVKEVSKELTDENKPNEGASSICASSVLSSKETFQETPGVSASSELQGTNFRHSVHELSDETEHENISNGLIGSCNHRKVPKRKIIPVNYRKTIEGEFITDNFDVTNYLSDSAKNEVKYITPIEPREITEAVIRFQEASPIYMIFTNEYHHLPRKTNLICLADSLSLDII